VDVHGTVVTAADEVAAAISKAASSQPSTNSSLQLLEADHVFNPDKQDAPGQFGCPVLTSWWNAGANRDACEQQPSSGSFCCWCARSWHCFGTDMTPQPGTLILHLTLAECA
jgi:hypothetical protein